MLPLITQKPYFSLVFTDYQLFTVSASRPAYHTKCPMIMTDKEIKQSGPMRSLCFVIDSTA